MHVQAVYAPIGVLTVVCGHTRARRRAAPLAKSIATHMSIGQLIVRGISNHEELFTEK